MIAQLDLHVHSAASHDGRLTPAEIINAARAAELFEIITAEGGESAS